MSGKNPLFAGLLAFFLFPFPIGHWYVGRLFRGMVLFAATMAIITFALGMGTQDPQELETLMKETSETGEIPSQIQTMQLILRVVYILDCMILAQRFEKRTESIKAPKLRFPLQTEDAPSHVNIFKGFQCRNCKSGLLPGSEVCPQCGARIKAPNTIIENGRVIHPR
ncbi:MAG: hypothetical protein ABH950_08910 [Candidatus Altiarchaeota archaeon]